MDWIPTNPNVTTASLAVALVGGLGYVLRKALERYVDRKINPVLANQEAQARVLEGVLNRCHVLTDKLPSLMGKVIGGFRSIANVDAPPSSAISELRAWTAALEDELHRSELVMTHDAYRAVHEFKELALSSCRDAEAAKNTTSRMSDEALRTLEQSRRAAIDALGQWARSLPGVKEMSGGG